MSVECNLKNFFFQIICPFLTASHTVNAHFFQAFVPHLVHITIWHACYYYYYSQPFSRITFVSQYQKGRTCLDLNEACDDWVWGWQWHQLDHMQTICILLQTDNHTNTSSLNFYRPDALPDAQPTVLKHWRHMHACMTWLFSIQFLSPVSYCLVIKCCVCTVSKSSLAERFSAEFSNLNLVEVLAEFSLPLSLREHMDSLSTPCRQVSLT